MLMSGTLRAQSVSGSIAGVVRDATGAVLPGVTVEAASPALIEKVRAVDTDDQGNYKIVDLRPGTYAVTFTLAGFNTFRRDGIELSAGFTATVNADLRVGALEETVTVSGASPVVDVQNVRSQRVLTRDILDVLPTGKTIQGFTALTVGATFSATGGNAQDVGGNKGEQYGSIMIHGSRADDSMTTYNGLRIHTMTGGGGGARKHFYINQAAVQEIVLETSGMSAENESGGVLMNVVPKDGGNTFRGSFNIAGTNGDLQSSNLTDELRARGLTTSSEVKKIWDVGGGFGGPIKKDRLWFYAAFRKWGSQEYAAGSFYNKTQSTPFYTPDLSRRGYTNFYQRDASARLTWQASSRNRFILAHSKQHNCQCHLTVDSGTRAPEAALDYQYWPNYMVQATWTYPATNRLLFEAGAALLHNNSSVIPADPSVLPTDIAITELSTNFTYNALASALYTSAYGTDYNLGQHNERLSMSYVTGSHAFKIGLFTLGGGVNLGYGYNNQALSYQFRNGTPVSITQWASPSHQENSVRNVGTYALDQWTVGRLTLNLGVRFDYLNGTLPAQTRPAGRFVPAFDIPRMENVLNFKDINPRIGAAYDLFGDGKTAFKVSLGRYMGLVAGQYLADVNPASALVASANRTWTDTNGNYIPDCDLQNRALNGECGPISNNKFGTVEVNTRYAPDVLEGFGNREYNWQTSVSVQHELRAGMAVAAGYFRTSFHNFRATNNVLVTPADYQPYCVTAPKDARLPGGGGYQVCELGDISLAKFGQVDNVVTQSSNFGKRSEVYDGIDVSLNARFGQGGLFQGGLNAGRTATECAVVDEPIQFCKNVPPFFRPQIKFAGSYPLPFWGLQTSATFQNLPGFPIAASYVATNAEVAPTLGRNLASCGTRVPCNGTVTINLIEPNTIFEDRLSQLDIRLTKTVRLGRNRIQGMFDIYNVFNGSTVLQIISRFGPEWQRPAGILGGRLFKFGAQFDF
jgi:hypothetical protein